MPKECAYLLAKRIISTSVLLAGFCLSLCACGVGGSNAANSNNIGSGAGNDAGGGGSGMEAPIAVFIYGQLWKTDGTSDGTTPVYVNGDAPFSFAFGITKFNGEYYFQANDSAHGFELWKTDGSAAGTMLIKDINPGPESSFTYRFSDFTAFDNALYFHAQDGVNGIELWRTDGTPEGTVLVKDINPVQGLGSAPSDFTVFQGALYFSANDTGGNRKLWKTDGSMTGTTPVTDVSIGTGTSFLPDDYSHGFPSLNDALYFRGPNGSLWKTDGTLNGTVLAEDIRTAAGWDASYLFNGFRVFNGILYLAADDGMHGREIWGTNGTGSGTALLKDINTESGGRRSDYAFNEFTVFNGELYFQSRDNLNGFRLWKTDGSADGTVLVKSFGWWAASDFRVINNTLYFLNNGLWKSNGTSEGTLLVKSI